MTSRGERGRGQFTSTIILGGAALALAACEGSGEAIGNSLLGENGDGTPLAAVPVPQPIGGDIADTAAAVRLGKALFWDEQTGGDGHTACASCHFRGGADNRVFNTLNPGPDGIFASGGVTAAGQTFTPVNIANDDRVGSQGIVGSLFVSIDPDPSVAAALGCAEVTVEYHLTSIRRKTGLDGRGALISRFWIAAHNSG